MTDDAPAGLCGTCGWAREVKGGHGSSFTLCRRSADDPRYPRYPRLPVRQCEGYDRAARFPAGNDPERRD